jgi:hypothetical protein
MLVLLNHFSFFFYVFFDLLSPAGILVFCDKKLLNDKNMFLYQKKKGLNFISLLFCL